MTPRTRRRLGAGASLNERSPVAEVAGSSPVGFAKLNVEQPSFGGFRVQGWLSRKVAILARENLSRNHRECLTFRTECFYGKKRQIRVQKRAENAPARRR